MCVYIYIYTYTYTSGRELASRRAPPRRRPGPGRTGNTFIIITIITTIITIITIIYRPGPGRTDVGGIRTSKNYVQNPNNLPRSS